MDTDTENQLNDEIQREIVNVVPKKTKQKKAKKATTASKKIKNSKRTTVVESMDLSSDSSAGDPDFDPDKEVTGGPSTRMKTRNRSKSTSQNH